MGEGEGGALFGQGISFLITFMSHMGLNPVKDGCVCSVEFGKVSCTIKYCLGFS